MNHRELLKKYMVLVCGQADAFNKAFGIPVDGGDFLGQRAVENLEKYNISKEEYAELIKLSDENIAANLTELDPANG